MLCLPYSPQAPSGDGGRVSQAHVSVCVHTGPWGKWPLGGRLKAWPPLTRKQGACLSRPLIKCILAHSGRPQATACFTTFGNHAKCFRVLVTVTLFVTRADATPVHQKLCPIEHCQLMMRSGCHWVSALALQPQILKGNGQNQGVPNSTHCQRTAEDSDANFHEIHRKFKPVRSRWCDYQGPYWINHQGKQMIETVWNCDHPSCPTLALSSSISASLSPLLPLPSACSLRKKKTAKIKEFSEQN